MLTPLIHAHGGRDSGEVVGAYVFSATLAIQDITGLAASGVTASHMAKRLEGSAESEAYLFALTSVAAPRPLGPLGYPAIHASDLQDIEAWVFVSLPLLEDTGVIEATVTLDAAIAPLPGEEVPREPWVAALSLIDALSSSLSRPTRQIWVTHSGEPSEIDTYLAEYGYAPAYQEAQATFSLESVEAGPQPAVVRNMDFAPADLPSLRALLTASSRDYPRGDLILDTVEWTEQRVRDAGARLLDRGGHQLTALVYSDAPSGSGMGDYSPDGSAQVTGSVIGMAEAVHYESDDDRLVELGLVYVLSEHRGKGLGATLVRDVLAAAKTEWPKLSTGYCSYPADSEPSLRLVSQYNPTTISNATAWQKRY